MESRVSPRIASLLPSATELLSALGLEPHLVGISHCCDFPPGINRPVLTESVVDPSLSSTEIDRITKETLAAGESLYRINEPLLASLRPTLVVTQALCDVCAVSFPSVARAVEKLQGTSLLSLEPGCIEDILNDVIRLGAATGRASRAAALVSDARTRIEALNINLRDVARPRVLTLEWFEPAYFGGHWVPEQVQLGGGVSVLGQPNQRSEGVAWETIAQADPDVILCMPCGYSAKQTRARLRAIEQQQSWRDLRAVQAGRVFCLDANSYFSRPSLRVITGAELIGHVLHPELVNLPEGAELPIQVGVEEAIE